MALQLDLWYNERNIDASAMVQTSRGRVHLIGDAPMDTVPHYPLYNNYQKFYVYTLAYPDGRIFYIGKGQQYENGNERLDMHEAVVHRDVPHYNEKKALAIKEIWASGEEVVKTKVAFFGDEIEAYMYEWALINMTAYSQQLTNILRGPCWPSPRTNIELPEISKPLCFRRGNRKNSSIYHQITDLEEFRVKHTINARKLKDIVEGKIYAYCGWHLVKNCCVE